MTLRRGNCQLTRQSRAPITLLFCLVLFCCANGWAQIGANIDGVVSDNTGAAVVGATVVITNTNTGVSQNLITGESGNYRAVNLQPATYRITAEMTGFAKLTKTVTLLVGSNGTVDFTLGIAGLTENVEVSDEVPMVEVTKSQPSSVIGEEQVSALPVLSRNFMVLAQIMPSAAPMANLGVFSKFTLTKFGGVSDQRNGYTTVIDGATIDDATWGSPVINLPQDAVQEFKVFRHQFDAEYGNAQAAVINVVSRPGSDHYHGSAYYFGRDKALDARNALATLAPPFRQLRAGGTVGGPLLSSKSHFFAGYENLNVNTAFIEALPPSNPFASQVNGNYPYTSTENQFVTKVDHRFNDAHSFYIRYAYDNQFTPTGGPVNSANNQTDESHSHSVVAEENWVVSQNKVNTIRFSYLHHNLFTLPSNSDVTIVRPGFSFGSNDVDPQYFPRDDESISDMFFINLPKHDIKFGGSITHALSNYQAHYYQHGEFDFATDAPFNVNDPSTYPYAFIQQTPGNFKYTSNQIATFIQDDWRVLSRVRLNLGLRWDVDTNLRDNAFYYRLLKDPRFAGLENFISRNRGNQWTNVQPRFGVTWDLKGNGGIVLHAGAGKYVTRNRPWFQEQSEQQTSGASAYITNPNALKFFPDINAVLGGKSLADYVASGGPRFASIMPNDYRLPYSLNFTGGVGWQITRNSSMTADLVYDRTGDELASYDLNLPRSGSVSSTNPRPVAQFSQVMAIKNCCKAWYKALETQYRTRMKGIDNLQVSYTYSTSPFAGVVNYWIVPGTLRTPNNHALNPTDTPQNLSVAWTSALLPWKFQFSGVVRAISGGPLNAQAGFDLDGDTIVSNDNPRGLPQTVGRGNVSEQLRLINAFRSNPCAYVYTSDVPCSASPVAPISRDLLNISNVIDVDLRLTKVIPFSEARRLELFFEGYNVTNHVTKYGGNPNMISPDFLIRTSALDPRQLQWGARFTF
jgi:Carboxypeptidase regulatory-like domain